MINIMDFTSFFILGCEIIFISTFLTFCFVFLECLLLRKIFELSLRNTSFTFLCLVWIMKKEKMSVFSVRHRFISTERLNKVKRNEIKMREFELALKKIACDGRMSDKASQTAQRVLLGY